MSTKKRDAMTARILDAALGVLAGDGMPALTQPRIAAAAGIRQSHLTYYFPTRSALVAAVADAVAQRLLARFDAALAASDAGAMARGIARAGVPEETRLLLALVLAAEQEKPVRGLFRSLTKEVRARIAAGLARHGMAADAEAVAMVHALAVGLAVLDLARSEPASRRELKTLTARALSCLTKAGRSRS